MKRTDDQIRCQFFKELNATERMKVLRVFLDIPDAAAAEVNSHSIEAKLLSTILRPAPALVAQPVAVVTERMAPVQGYKAGIPWSLHLEAYDAYSKKWAPQQALIEGGCRGGFGTGELDDFIPGWREKVSEIGRLKARVAALDADVAWHKESLSHHSGKLAAVWADIERIIAQHTGAPCGPEPLDDLAAILGALPAPSDATRDVLAERRRQVEAEGYDAEHDDAHPSGEIAAYAAFYAMPEAAREWPATETGYGDTFGQAIVPANWTVPKTGDRRRELVKAAALLLAEIERIDRVANKSGVAS